jgi:hypothetical protein
MTGINGYPVGIKLDENNVPADTPKVVPPDLQTLHICLSGRSGSGKSTQFETALLHNQRATTGSDIVFDSKGDGMLKEFLRIKYAADGTLADVLYFDLEDTVPAIGFFDLRGQLQDGHSRQQAISRIADHYLELAEAAYPDGFDDAKRARRLIRDLIRALFDPVHGADAYCHRDLQAAARELKTEGVVPSVSDPELEARLAERTAIPEDTRIAVVDAVTDRLDAVTDSPQLHAMLNHLPPAPSDHDDTGVSTDSDSSATTTPEGRRFSFRQLLSDDIVVLFDTSGLGRHTEAVTLALLSGFWRACQRRKAAAFNESFPVANLYLEEAGTFAASGLFTQLLPLARGFDVGIVLLVQYPGQLLTDSQATQDNLGILNNIGTVISGQVAGDDLLASYFSGVTLDKQAARDRLDSLDRGEWLIQLPESFHERRRKPFQAVSLPLPPGHPESDTALPDIGLETAFEAALEDRQAEINSTVGIRLETTASAGAATPSPDADGYDVPTATSLALQRRSVLPQTKRLPDCVSYLPARHRIQCVSCDTTYAPTLLGLFRTIECCNTLATVDRADIPVVECHPNLTGTEAIESELTSGQLCFMQLVHQATRQQVDPRTFRLTDDSMVRLREYAGLEKEAVTALTDESASITFGIEAATEHGEPLVRIDTKTTPHRVYSLTDAGRTALGISLRNGRDYGDYIGDLGESTLHRLMVLAACQFLDQQLVEATDSPATDVVAYYPVDGKRLDAAAITDNGTIVAAVEAETSTHDHKTAVPVDYDTMAACQPEMALWVVPNRDSGHSVLNALNNPATGDTRVDKTYSASTPPRQFQINADGCTRIISISRLLKNRETPAQPVDTYLRHATRSHFDLKD